MISILSNKFISNHVKLEETLLRDVDKESNTSKYPILKPVSLPSNLDVHQMLNEKTQKKIF